MPDPVGVRNRFRMAHLKVGLQLMPATPDAFGSGGWSRPFLQAAPSCLCQGTLCGGGGAFLHCGLPEGGGAVSRPMAGFSRNRAAQSSNPSMGR